MKDKREAADEAPQSNRRRLYPDRLILFNLAIVLSSASCFGVGYFFGGLRSTGKQYIEQYNRERELVEPILANDAAFVEVRLSPASSGGISLTGVVPTQQDRTRLLDALSKVLGEPRAKEILRSGVTVLNEPRSPPTSTKNP